MSEYTPPAPKFTVPSDGSVKLPLIPTITLNNGTTMPVVAYGTFRSQPGEVVKAVYEAIKVGYRHFDLAHVYGNEKEVGEAFANAIKDGLISGREELYITGKLWNSDHDVEIVPQACDHSLQNLGIDYFDLYLIHFPVCWKHTGLSTPSWGSSELGSTPLIATWHAMEDLVHAGKCKSIGVSNYPLLLLHDLTTQVKQIQPACNQIETHVYYTRESLVNYCISRNICVTAHTPLGGGQANVNDWKVLPPLKDETVNKIATAHNKTPAQVLLRFLLQRGIVVLPKSVKVSRMEENIDLFDFELSADDMSALAKLDKYMSYKTNPNPLSAFLGGPDAFSADGTDIFD